MSLRDKYARIEWERRFLLEGFAGDLKITKVRRITDRYITGTNLRLREQSGEAEPTVFKLTQKLPGQASGARQGLITTMYLTRDEFWLLAKLPAKILSKTRYSVPPFGIDAFEGELHGLLLAEAEFDSAGEASRLKLPAFIACEVTNDLRFTGGSLVSATRQELQNWLREYGMTMHHGSRGETV